MELKPDKEFTVPSKMYVLNGIPYLPHYINPHVYVAPGSYEFKESTLVMMGAVEAQDFLWERRWQQ